MATAVVRAFREQRPEIELEVIGRGATSQLSHGWLAPPACHQLTGRSYSALRGRFDLGVLLPDSFSSAWLFARMGLPSLGRTGEGRSFLLRHRRRPRPRPPVRHLVEEWDDLLEPLGVSPSRFTPQLCFSDAETQAGRSLLPDPGSSSPVVALCPGAAFGPAKRWPVERYLGLARDLRELGIRCVVSGGRGEEAVSAEVARAAGTNPVLGLPLRTWGALLAACDVVVANDSGAAHVAAAAGTRVAAIFGSTNPVWSRPRGEGHTVLYRGLSWSPCLERECPLGHLDCLTGVSVRSVVEVVQRMLGEGAR